MTQANSRQITNGASLLLDGLRLSAALTVLVLHARDQWFPRLMHQPDRPGNALHAAVVVFFVLSGYVIAHSVTNSNRGLTQYAQARLSRLYSVVLPALFLTGLIEGVVRHVAPALHALYSRGASWPRYVISALFLNESWFVASAPLINGPLWSLSFEFWYYAIFGLYFYGGRGRAAFLLPAAAGLIAGPKVLLLMPIWLAGYNAYRLPGLKVAPWVGWLLVLAALGAAVALVAFLPVYPYGVGYMPLGFASAFVSDFVVGLFVALALWLLPSKDAFAVPAGLVASFRSVADLTFPIYILHVPLLILYRALFGFRANDPTQLGQAIAAVLLVSAAIGVGLERQRFLWVRLFKWLLNAKPTQRFAHKVAAALRVPSITRPLA